jgi:lipid A 4'-phosphatase
VAVSLAENPGGRRAMMIYLAAVFASAVLFALFPRIDIWVSSWFWSPQNAWFLNEWGPFGPITRLVPQVTDGIVAAAALLLFVGYLYDWWLSPFDRRGVIYILLTIALGPGLLANTILKDHWGRARPAQILEFGGTKHFTPALFPADQCDTNCSFVSGHGAMAFSLIAFAFLIRHPVRRRRGIAAALAFGVVVGFTRIAQGRHFLSDTIDAALLMIGLSWLLHRWIIVQDGLSRPWIAALLAGSATLARAIWRLLRWLYATAPRRWWVFHAACLAAFLVSVYQYDQGVARYFDTDHDRLSALFGEITKLGLGETWMVPSGFLVVVLLAIAYSPRFVHARERWLSWAWVPGYLFLVAAISGLIADLAKILIGRTRPVLLFRNGEFTWTGLSFHADHWSLPSGHTTTAAAIATALTILWPRHVAAYVLVALLVALSRVGLGEHYLSDTIAGAWLGVVSTAYLTGVLHRSGIDLDDAKRGVAGPSQQLGWRHRLLGF